MIRSHYSVADDTLTIGYNEKPPLFYTENGQAKGVMVKRARVICKLSGINCTFEKLPFLRIMAYLKNNRPNFAALGFSKSAERESISVFSEPIYQDQPPVLVIRQSDLPKFKLFTSFAALLESRQFILGEKRGNVYPIDALIDENNTRREISTQDTPELLKMLLLSRFDYLMLYPEEYDWIKQTTTKLKLTTIRYSDMPIGSKRYLLFSKTIPQSLVTKLNAAIKVSH